MLFRNRVFDDLFDEMFKDPFFTHTYDNGTTSQIMKTDVQEKDTGYMVDIELPGFAKEDVKAELKDGYLTITANRDENKEQKDDNGKFIRRERYTGTCKRTFYVGEGVKQEDIKAGFKDGILRLAIPKADQPKLEDQSKLITIE